MAADCGFGGRNLWELLLAAVATLVWWAAEPGVLSSLCLNVMLVASLGTLVLNGNPLMRYDGYYILADLIEVPNLEQQSRSQLVAWLGAGAWGPNGTWRMIFHTVPVRSCGLRGCGDGLPGSRSSSGSFWRRGHFWLRCGWNRSATCCSPVPCWE